jgi:hypothetical protein
MAAVAGEDGRVEYRYRTPPPRSTREQTTMEQLQSCFDVLTLESAECFFEKNAEKLSSDGYVICNGVSVETWNCFLDQREEDLPICLRKQVERFILAYQHFVDISGETIFFKLETQ